MGTGGSFLEHFGDELRLHRERAGMTQTDVGERVGYGNGLISKIERAERVPQPELCTVLDELFGTQGSFGRLGKRVREHSGATARFREYLERERDAVAIYDYESHMVPGLLQTEAYARCVIEARRPNVQPDEIASRLAARMTRQEILTTDAPPRLWVILGEAVLNLMVGSEQIMVEQLQRILEAAQRPEVTVQVLPNSAGVTCALGVSFLMAEFAEGHPALHIDAPPGITIVAEKDSATDYRLIFDHLRVDALPERHTLAMVRSKVEELNGR